MRGKLVLINSSDYKVEIVQELSGHLYVYDVVYEFEPNYLPSSSYGVTCLEGGSCLLITSTSVSFVHEDSALILGSKIFVGIGNRLVCLTLPELDMTWNMTIDDAMCYGIYMSPDGLGILTHGELFITKVSFTGEKVWIASGKDIFSGGFSVYDTHIEAIDFNNEKYRIDIISGRCVTSR